MLRSRVRTLVAGTAVLSVVALAAPAAHAESPSVTMTGNPGSVACDPQVTGNGDPTQGDGYGKIAGNGWASGGVSGVSWTFPDPRTIIITFGDTFSTVPLSDIQVKGGNGYVVCHFEDYFQAGDTVTLTTTGLLQNGGGNAPAISHVTLYPGGGAERNTGSVVGPIKSVAAGTCQSLVTTTTGQVYTWGDNRVGELGDGTTDNSSAPVQAVGLNDVVQVDGSFGSTPDFCYSLALTSSGQVYAWGNNRSGQLGNGTQSNMSSVTNAVVPGPVLGLTDVVQVSAGYDFALAVTSSGKVYAWGSNQYGQLGLGDSVSTGVWKTPVQIPELTDVVQVSAGWYASFALTSSGKVYAWGRNTYGQLGNGKMANGNDPSYNVYLPAQVQDLSGVAQISAGNNHVLALASSGQIYAWGDGSNGQLGTGKVGGAVTSVSSAVPVPVLDLTDVVQVAAGYGYSLALTSTGQVYAWGWNSSLVGQLGLGPTPYSSSVMPVPTLVTALSGVKQLATGNSHSLALTTSGQVYAWGSNTYGQLGDGTTNISPVPLPVPGVGGR